MTAHEAWAVVAPVAKARDPAVRPTVITSGLDMSHEGRSLIWEFIFHLPGRGETVILSLEPEPGSDVDAAPTVLTQRIHPASAIDGNRAAFPERFRDSPEVVAEFAARGIDFVAGPTDMKLEGRIRHSGKAVWVTYFCDGEHTSPFPAVGD